MNERLGTELSAAARQVIAESRGADDPSAEDEARVKARWLAGIAAGAGVSSLSEAVRAAASTGWGLKAGALVAALAAATAGVYLGWPQLSESKRVLPAGSASQAAPSRAPAELVVTPPSPAPAAPALAPAAPAERPLDVNPVDEKVQPAPSAAAAPEVAPAAAPSGAAPAAAQKTAVLKAARAPTPSRSVAHRVLPEKAPAEPAAAALSGQLGEEIALLSDIRGELQAGAAARALERLADYRQRFGQPNLAMEADALQVDALCRVGQREEARAAAAAFTSRWPGSPLQQRVSAACP